jgi:AcrR family transcriptional regulator
MAKAVKPRRSYDSSHRREQAAATREKILVAARELFDRDGYAATSMASISKRAGVSLKTAYLAFETKSGLLRALWNLQLRGDEEKAPVEERSWYREALEEPDPKSQLLLVARNSRAVKERVGTLLEVIRAAAPTDADIGALWKRIEADFLANQRAIAESLDEKEALAPGLTVDQAADILWSANLSNLWPLLVGERSWSPAAYEDLLGEIFISQLLAPRRGKATSSRSAAR